MIYVVVALTAEARPLIGHFQLEPPQGKSSLPMYCGADLALVVSGVGKEASGQAVAELGRMMPSDRPAVWLNVGVAGHRRHEIGTTVLARTVTDAESGAVFRLQPPEDLHIDIGEVRTVSHVETRYETSALYDMEAAAFCEQAGALTDTSLIQVLKIVSDNRRTGTVCVSARQVQGLVEDSFPRIDRAVSSLYRRARRLGR